MATIPTAGTSCDDSHNPGNDVKPCIPVPGNGRHRLPATPCDRGHNGVKAKNKHCGPDLAIVKEESRSANGPFTDGLDAPLSSNVYYRITVSNFTDTDYTLVASDPVCADNINGHALIPSGTNTVLANSDFVYTCDVDALPGESGIPDNAAPGGTPDTLTNTVTVAATPVGGGASVTLTDGVSASVN